MGWLSLRGGKKTLPESAQPTAVSGDRYDIPGFCSKTGASIVFVCTLRDGYLHVDEMTLAKSGASGLKGSPPAAQSLPAFEGDPRDRPICPSCRIRVRRGSYYFQCHICKTNHCMGSHRVEGGLVWMKCVRCGGGGPLTAQVKEVIGSKSTLSTHASLGRGNASTTALPDRKRLQ